MVKFKNPAGFRKCWGEAAPDVLAGIFSYLNAAGFHGPNSWKSPLNLSFHRRISDDFSADVFIKRVGEFPSGVFNFDTAIAVRSKTIAEVEEALDLYPVSPEMAPYVEAPVRSKPSLQCT